MHTLQKIVARILIVSLVCLHPSFTVLAAQDEEGDPSLQIVHSPQETVKAGEAIHISAEIEAMEGIELARIYFRSVGSRQYYFVPMVVGEGSTFTGFLPPPTIIGESVEYLFLVKTYNNRIFKSQSFTAKVEGHAEVSPSDETVAIDVLTETMQVPQELIGFDPKTKIRPVTKPEKHGVLAGLYDPEETGGSTSNGQYHGTVIATEKSYFNLILIGGGVLLGAGIIAVAAGSSGSGGGGSSPTDTTSDATGAGIWTLDFSYDSCSKNTSQTVQCSDEGLVTAVSPTAIGVPLPDSCDNSPYEGLSDLFVVGGSCDTVTACGSFSSSDLTIRSCSDSTIVLVNGDGSRVETWTQ